MENYLGIPILKTVGEGTGMLRGVCFDLNQLIAVVVEAISPSLLLRR